MGSGQSKMQQRSPSSQIFLLIFCLLAIFSPPFALMVDEVNGLPAADRVVGGEQQEADKPGGAAAVGLMHHAVKSKGPDDTQVNAIAGFGHQIMQLVDEIEREKNDEDEVKP